MRPGAWHPAPGRAARCPFFRRGPRLRPFKNCSVRRRHCYKLDLHEVSRLQRSVLTIRPERRLLDGKMAEKDDVLLNSREVAFLLDLSPDTVNEFARRNIIPAFKKGRQWRFRKRDIASVKRQLRGVNAAA